jgi:hypothetical protein
MRVRREQVCRIEQPKDRGLAGREDIDRQLCATQVDDPCKFVGYSRGAKI